MSYIFSENLSRWHFCVNLPDDVVILDCACQQLPLADKLAMTRGNKRMAASVIVCVHAYSVALRCFVGFIGVRCRIDSGGLIR